MDITVGSDLVYFTDATINVDYTASVGESYALSILRNDGLGAKVIYSCSAQRSRTNLDLSDIESTAYVDDMTAWAESQTVNVKVYDDDNELIGNYNLPLYELAAFSEFIDM